MDGDGLIDIVVTMQTSSKTLSWFKNLGDGSFGSEQVVLTNSIVKSFKLVDMDNDNDSDILLDYIDNNSGARNISELKNDSFGTFQQNVLYNITPVENYRNDITYADIDNDGDNDIVYSTKTSLVYLENDGTGNYQVAQNIYPINFCYSVQVTDVNNDNLNDIIATSLLDGKIFWLENTQDTNGIEEEQSHKFIILPNPVTELLKISTDNIRNIEVLDRMGRLIEKFESTNEIDFSNYKTGLYLIIITDENNNVDVQKVLKK